MMEWFLQEGAPAGCLRLSQQLFLEVYVMENSRRLLPSSWPKHDGWAAAGCSPNSHTQSHRGPLVMLRTCHLRLLRGQPSVGLSWILGQPNDHRVPICKFSVFIMPIGKASQHQRQPPRTLDS